MELRSKGVDTRRGWFKVQTANRRPQEPLSSLVCVYVSNVALTRKLLIETSLGL